MKAAALPFILSLALLAAPNSAWARDAVLPAGTLVHCTLDEPNFSSATASVGDPVLCYPHGLQVFGQNLFPRGSYIVGHLADDKDPGHFWGKGSLKIEFDRIGLPSADLPLSAKIIAVSGGYRVDREGKIIGKGHAKRDVVEWMLPPLWPWKIITLPARGPRPVLKSETRVTLRLMDDVLVPDSAEYRHFGRLGSGPAYGHPALYLRPQQQLAAPSGLREPVYRTISWQAQSASSGVAGDSQPGTQGEYRSGAAEHGGWHSFRKSAAAAPASARMASSTATAIPDAMDTPSSSKTVDSDNTDAVDNDASAGATAQAKQESPVPAEVAPTTGLGAQTIAVPAIKAVEKTAVAQDKESNSAPPTIQPAVLKIAPAEDTAAPVSPPIPLPKAKLTLIAVRTGTVYAVTDYWRNEDHLGYVLANGKEGEVDLSELDWKTTSQLNAERNVKVTLREGK